MNKKIGEIIKERLEAENINVTKFATLIERERTNVYNIFKRESIDTDLLKKIGQVLNYDFFQHFIEPNTIEKIKYSNSSKKTKVLIELELTDDEIKNIDLEDKALKVLKIHCDNNLEILNK